MKGGKRGGAAVQAPYLADGVPKLHTFNDFICKGHSFLELNVQYPKHHPQETNSIIVGSGQAIVCTVL
jgi:hypothetical protein